MSLNRDPEPIGHHDPLGRGPAPRPQPVTCSGRTSCAATATFMARLPPGERDRTAQICSGRYLHFLMLAKGGKRGSSRRRRTRREPPSTRCARSARKPVTTAKECRDEAGRAVFRHLDRLVVASVLCNRLVWRARILSRSKNASIPETCGKRGKIPRLAAAMAWAHSSVRPFQGSPVASRRSLRGADRHHELHDLAGDPDHDHDRTERRQDQPGPPARIVVMLHPPGSCPSGRAHRAA